MISVAASDAAQALQRIASGLTYPGPSVLMVHVRAAHQSTRVPHPTSHPPCTLAQNAKSGGASHSTAGRFSDRRSNRTSTEKHSTEKSCGRTCCALGRMPPSASVVTIAAGRSSAPSPVTIRQTQSSDSAMNVNFRSTRPASPAVRYADAMMISDSHSWLVHGLSDVNEYVSGRRIVALSMMSPPKRT